MSKLRFVAGVMPVALALGIADLHAAPTQAQQQAIRSSCQSDYRSYCASVPTGGPEALQCLQKNISKLSLSCQQAVQAATGSQSTAPESGTAATTTTTTAPPATTTAPTSKSVTVIMLKPSEELALMRKACGADYRAHCAGVRIIGGAALSCLVSHSASLTSSCKRVLSKLGQRF
jgi:hypothetical protein